MAHLARLVADRPGWLIVAGGGTFADAVRDAQAPLGLSDRACHRMALLAMEQTAYALQDLAPALRAVTALDNLSSLARGSAVWFPSRDLMGHPHIPESWDVTSDSLACWLATVLKAPRLVLVKAAGALSAAAHRTSEADVRAWAKAGLVDAACPRFAAAFDGPLSLVPADDGAALAHLLPAAAKTSAA
ncbi:hypothetical protein J5J86_11910 [Aquabacter sp. L1I39]|uniref:hypothetical protein n=1 Tax=Aquabacter sp. L1I39 TaxID=2820278 RepID=UPI001ADC9276|nr:hypothetical protein [Aquabacter sp. L1I39]QTL05933.1 hypothetical protein J5J86_11910 [Aquabacter sp. L1I39]